MPIRPELRKFYGRGWREDVRPRILARATDENGCTRCEQCQAPNLQILDRLGGMWRAANWWHDLEGKPLQAGYEAAAMAELVAILGPPRRVRIILTIAHLNHIAGDDRDDNLRALCQWCHLHHDQQQHVAHAHETRATHKDAARPLLAP